METFSILIAARKNSKYLAKFLFGLYENTSNIDDCQVLVMLNKHDTWNKELVEYFSWAEDIEFFYEDLGLGRTGLHLYFNTLLKHAIGDWVVYWCEDHQIILPGWDKVVIEKIDRLKLDPNQVWCLIPKFDNVGAMNQILSRGYIKAMGGILSRHGNLDSYINDVNEQAFGEVTNRRTNYKLGDRILRFDEEMAHDFSHDIPSPMHDSYLQSVPGRKAIKMPKYNDPIIQRFIKKDAGKIRKALNEEN